MGRIQKERFSSHATKPERVQNNDQTKNTIAHGRTLNKRTKENRKEQPLFPV
jgi:hypothetical protein